MRAGITVMMRRSISPGQKGDRMVRARNPLLVAAVLLLPHASGAGTLPSPFVGACASARKAARGQPTGRYLENRVRQRGDRGLRHPEGRHGYRRRAGANRRQGGGQRQCGHSPVR